jgi:acid phosphatase (class A)
VKTPIRILSTLVVLALVIAARADTLNFLCKRAVDPAALLPPPPAATSEEGRAELDFLFALQQKRTPQQLARCRAEISLSMATFQGAMGPWFTPANLPQLDRLWKKVDQDSSHFVGLAKKHFNRLRPADEDSRITWAVRADASLAYPSGHSTWGTVHALLLAELCPERRAALLDRGREIGWDRCLAGAHHYSDVVAGRVLGRALWQALLCSPQFRDELAKVKAEFDAAARPAAPVTAP